MLLLAACRGAPPPPPQPLRLTLPEPDALVVGGGLDYAFGLALAPDGRRLVFPAVNAADGRHRGPGQLWIRDLRSHDLMALPGTERAVMPFWSPDGASIGFFADGKLRALALTDATVRDLADVSEPRGAAWLPSGDIVFAPAAAGGLLRRTPDGEIAPFTALASGETSHRLPHPFGDDHVIFFVRAAEGVRRGLWLASRTAPEVRKRLTNSDAGALSIEHVVVYSSGGALVAQAVDLENLSLAAKPVLLATSVGHSSANQLFAAAGGDVLIHGAPSSGLRDLRWVDTSGNTVATLGEPMHAWEMTIAPAASRVAVARVDPQLDTLDIWTYEAQRPVPRRVSSSINVDETPVWSRDGSRIAWINGGHTLVVRDATAAEPEVMLRKFERPVRISDWAPDDRLVMTEVQQDSLGDIVIAPLRAERATQVYLRSPFDEMSGTVSPDGRWLAYLSNESGRFEVYVDAFPTPRARSRLTVGGAAEPRWSRDGRRIYFRRGGEIHAVAIENRGGAIAAVASQPLFDVGTAIRAFDVAPDGQRFLLNVPASDSPSRGTPLTVLVNVASLLPSAP